MSAPILTPRETPIFDDDVIAEMSAHLHEDVPCMQAGCPMPADWQLIARCCGDRRFICSDHLASAAANWDEVLGRDAARCASCEHLYGHGVSFGDVFRVVVL